MFVQLDLFGTCPLTPRAFSPAKLPGDRAEPKLQNVAWIPRDDTILDFFFAGILLECQAAVLQTYSFRSIARPLSVPCACVFSPARIFSKPVSGLHKGARDVGRWSRGVAVRWLRLVSSGRSDFVV